MSIRSDSKSIAILAIFTSLVIALEVFPIVGVTDLYTPVPNFTIDWTGIPIMIVFLGLGVIFSFFTIGVMWVFIAYRNFQGAAFKGLAEFFTILGVVIARLLLRNRKIDWKQATLVYILFGCVSRGLGMLFGNTILLQFFYGLPIEVAYSLSLIYVPWNILQALINIIGGIILYNLIPESIRIQAGLDIYRASAIHKYEEISSIEIEAIDDE